MRTFVLSGGQATASDYPRGTPETPSFTEAVARYLSRSTRARTTIAVYRCHFRTLMRFHSPGVPLFPFDVESYVRHRIASARPYTVRQELITLRVLLRSEGLEPVTIPGLPTAQDGRRVLLNRELFLSLAEARWVIDRWRLDYNHQRRHSSLDYQTPAAFAANCDLNDGA